MSAEVSHQIQEDDVAGVCENDQRFETMDQCIVNRKKRYERGFPDARAVVSVADGPAMVFLPGNGSTVVVTMGFINATHANSASLPVLHQGILCVPSIQFLRKTTQDTHFTTIESRYDRFHLRHYSNTTSTIPHTGKGSPLMDSSKVVEWRNLAGMDTIWLIWEQMLSRPQCREHWHWQQQAL